MSQSIVTVLYCRKISLRPLNYSHKFNKLGFQGFLLDCIRRTQFFGKLGTEFRRHIWGGRLSWGKWRFYFNGSLTKNWQKGVISQDYGLDPQIFQGQF